MSKIATKTLRTSKGTVQIGEPFPSGISKKEMDTIASVGGVAAGESDLVVTETSDEINLLKAAQKTLGESQTKLALDQTKLSDDRVSLTEEYTAFGQDKKLFEEIVADRAKVFTDLTLDLGKIAKVAAAAKTDADIAKVGTLVLAVETQLAELAPKPA